MKKSFIIIFGILLCFSLATYANPKNLSSYFIHCLYNCKQFTHDDGRKITVIMGWANRKCYFKEITHNRTISCALRPLELEHFTSEVQKQFDYTEGLASAVKAKPYFLSKDTCTVSTRVSDGKGF